MLDKDCKRNWKILNGLLGKKRSDISDHFLIEGSKVTDPNKIANSFCKYFIEHPKSIHSAINPSNNDYSNLINNYNHAMRFYYCTEMEISKEIKKLKKEGSKDDLPRKFLKLCNEHVSKFLCYLFNLCIEKGIYPDAFKMAKITPLYKKGSKSEIENHRPVSVLCNVGKIFESLIHSRITNYFETFGLLSGNQFGFRKNKNTELASFQLLSKVMPALEKGSYCILVFLDYSACFDTLSREILFEKLYKYGIRGKSLNFIKSYFSNRKQFVNYNDVSSRVMSQDLGVIQGSKNGPLFFDIYSNDFNKLFDEDDHVLYADDTTLVFVGDDLPMLSTNANNKLSKILDYCNFNKLKLNPIKCEYMLVTYKHINVEPRILIGNEPIKRVDSFKYLGLHIDEKLKFHSQTKHIKSKLTQYCGITYRLRKFLNLRSAKNMYYACVYSTITYCVCAWGGILHCTQRVDSLSKSHARIVKNLFGKFYDNPRCLFKELKILKLKDIYTLYAAIYMFKIRKLNLYPTLQNNLDLQTPEHDHLTRNRNKFLLPFPRIDSVRINFKYQITRIWNELPEVLKNIDKLSTFKKRLTKHLLDTY